MESWPTLGWLLFLSLIADCLKGTRARDFTVKDIVYLHPSSKICEAGRNLSKDYGKLEEQNQ